MEGRDEHLSDAKAVLRRGQCCCKADHNSEFWAHLGYVQGEGSKLLHRLSIIKPNFFLMTSFNDFIFTGCLYLLYLLYGWSESLYIRTCCFFYYYYLVRFLVSKPVCEVDQVDPSGTKIIPYFCQQGNQIKQHSWELLSNLCPYIHGALKRRPLWYQRIKYDKIFDKELYQENPRTTFGFYVKILLVKTYISPKKLIKLRW